MEAPADLLEYEVTLEDIHAFNDFYSRTAPHARQTRMAVRLVLTFILAALLVSLGLLSQASLLFWLIGGLILLSWWAIFPRRLEQMQRRSTARMYAEGKNAGVLGPHRLTLEEEWLSERTDLREVRTHWRAIEQVVETDTHLFLFVSSFSAVIVPRRAFPSEAEGRAFGKLAEERRAAAQGEMGALG